MPSNHLIPCWPFSSCLQSFPASGSLPVSQFFTSDGQSIGASASVSVLPLNIQYWFPLGWLVWSPCSPRDSQESSPTPQFKGINSSSLRHFYCSGLTSVHDYWKNHIWTFFTIVISLLSNMLSRFVIAFLPRTKCLLISWLQSLSTVILEPKKIKSVTVFHCFPIYLPWRDGIKCHDLSFLNVEFKPAFSLSSLTFIKRLFNSSSLSSIRVVSSAYLRLLIFLPTVLILLCFI